jgi:fatty acid/phospholipid biosynthesis enzyme
LTEPPTLAPFALAIDAMGGDRAPEMVVEGLAIAAIRPGSSRCCGATSARRAYARSVMRLT